MTQRQQKLGRWGAIVGLVTALLGIGAVMKRPAFDALDIATEQRVDTLVNNLDVKHERDIKRIEKKLDCALFDLPAGCKQTLSPHE